MYFLIYFSRCNVGILHKICIFQCYSYSSKYDIFAQKTGEQRHKYTYLCLYFAHILCIYAHKYAKFGIKYAIYA